MARRLKYSWATSRYVLGRDDGYRIRFVIECAEDMPEAVFAYRMLPLNPQTGAKAGHFSHICSPVDLEEYPEGLPTAGHLPEWFRLPYLDVLVRSITEADAFISDIQSDLQRLKSNLDRLDVISPVGARDLGGSGPCEPSSSDSSESSSLSSSLSSASLTLHSLRAVGTLARNIPGPGAVWENLGTGAGSEVGVSETGLNRSKTTLLSGQTSKILLIQGFPLADLPENAEIVGLVATLHLRDASAGPSSSSSTGSDDLPDPRLFYFRLYDPRFGPVGDENSQNTAIFGPDWQILTRGDPTDTWGLTNLSATMLRRGDFGVVLVVGLLGEQSQAVIEVDGVELEVYYRS